jgi:hypothetical protein
VRVKASFTNCNCVPGAPFEIIDMLLDSGQQDQSDSVVGGQTNTEEGHQGGKGVPIGRRRRGTPQQQPNRQQ